MIYHIYNFFLFSLTFHKSNIMLLLQHAIVTICHSKEKLRIKKKEFKHFYFRGRVSIQFTRVLNEYNLQKLNIIKFYLNEKKHELNPASTFFFLILFIIKRKWEKYFDIFLTKSTIMKFCKHQLDKRLSHRSDSFSYA